MKWHAKVGVYGVTGNDSKELQREMAAWVKLLHPSIAWWPYRGTFWAVKRKVDR